MNVKLNYALIFAVLLQAIGLIWYVSKLDSKVNILYEQYAQDSKAEVVENQVRMKLDIETLLVDVKELKDEIKKANNKDKKIMKQHSQIFKILKKQNKKKKNNNNTSENYGYE